METVLVMSGKIHLVICPGGEIGRRWSGWPSVA